jgi:hypothetical protein
MKLRILRTIGYLAIGVVAVSAAGTASAASSGLQVIGSARSSGDFAITAANGHKSGAKALYLRAYGRDLSAEAVVACSRGLASIGTKSTTLEHLQPGRLYRIKQPFAGECDVTASLNGSGAIRLQLLA